MDSEDEITPIGEGAAPVSMRQFATPGCKRCGGTGKVKTGPRIMDTARCTCSILNQRAYTNEQIIKRDFPPRARTMTFETFQTGGSKVNELALKAAQNFVERFLTHAVPNGWIVGFWGLPSAGKTHLAYAVALEVRRRFQADVVVLNVADMLRDEKRGWEDKSVKSPIDKAINAELLILDDLGAEYIKPGQDRDAVSWVSEQLYMILDKRIMHNRPTIYTTNDSPSRMEQRLGTSGENMRVWGRIQRAQLKGSPIEVKAVEGANRQDDEDAALLFA